MTDLAVVKFPVQVTLMDIPGKLRDHARLMEDRDRPKTLLIVELDQDGDVSTYCFRDNPSRVESIGILRLAQRLHEKRDDRDGI